MGNMSHLCPMIPKLAYYIIKGHFSRTVQVTLPKFILDLSLVVTSIVLKFHNIW